MLLNYIFLILGFGYAVFLPGFVVIEAFFSKLTGVLKVQLYFLFSVIVSSFLSYCLASVFGFSRLTLILGLVLMLLFLFGLVIKKGQIKFSIKVRSHALSLAVAFIVYLIFVLALMPAIFVPRNGYFVMGGPNWQDTAMHLSIIETISQGNFPPQAPYFGGALLSYYYFVDFHSALVTTFFGQFFPRVLVYLNPFFALVFFLAMYNLTFYLTGKKKTSIVSAVIAVLFGNLGFVVFLKDVFTGQSVFKLVESGAYGYDYSKLLQMVPVANYFLQNRPMMYGLGAVATVFLLTFESLDKKDLKLATLSGLVIGSLYKFQLFGLVVSGVFVGLANLTYLIRKEISWKYFVKMFIVSFAPFVFLYLIFPNPHIGQRDIVKVFKETFSFGPWQDHDLLWFVKFAFANFGIAFIFGLLTITKKEFLKSTKLVVCWFVMIILGAVPFGMKFTIYDGDMFKFFYYMVIPISVLASVFVFNFKAKIANLLLWFLIVCTISTSILTLCWSFLNKSTSYSFSEYRAGLWVRNNTPKNSMFITMPTVHSAVTDIGGRLRVISYITWPYSHGFNVGPDNVFARRDDVEKLYASTDYLMVSEIARKYGARYIYYGREERGKFPLWEETFANDPRLKKIYNSEYISIYEIF